MTPAPASARNSHSPANEPAGAPVMGSGGLPEGRGVAVAVSEGAGRARRAVAVAVAMGAAGGEGAGRVAVAVAVAVALNRGAGNGWAPGVGVGLDGGVGMPVRCFGPGVGVSAGTETPAVGVARRATTTFGPQDSAGRRRAAPARARVFFDAHLTRRRISSVRILVEPEISAERVIPDPILPAARSARETHPGKI